MYPPAAPFGPAHPQRGSRDRVVVAKVGTKFIAPIFQVLSVGLADKYNFLLAAHALFLLWPSCWIHNQIDMRDTHLQKSGTGPAMTEPMTLLSTGNELELG